MNRRIQTLERARWRRGIACTGALALAVSVVGRAEVIGLWIADDGRCLARDFRQVALVEGEQDVEFESLPAEADLETLQIWAPRAGVQLLDWSRAMKEDRRGRVRCHVRSQVPGPRVGLDLLYAFTGLTWAAHYDIWIRTEASEADRAVSADLRGSVEIRNHTGTAFSNVLVRLVGRESKDPAAKWPGFLLLDRRVPLSDAWFPETSDEEPAYAYSVPLRVSLPQQAEVIVSLINQSRVAAVREFVFSSDEIPLESHDFAPLREEIRFSYGAGAERATALPPGRVRVSVGPKRERVFDAAFKRAMPGSDIRVDVGPSDAVWGRRKLVERTLPVAGYRSETYELQIQNRSDSVAVVRIEEQPPTAPVWIVQKTSIPHEERVNRLFFRCTVPPRGEERVTYSIRVREPRL